MTFPKRAIVTLALVAIGCATTGRREELVTEGLASWYGQEFAGRTTANGEIFDPNELTAAHRTLPFGTLVRVTNSRNGASVVVRINDRGPFIHSRIIDLSYAAAKEIDMVEIGVTPVRIEIVRLASRDEPPAPYVVSVEEPAEKAPTGPIPDEPPEVDFPLPESAGVEAESIEEPEPVVVSDVSVEVIESEASEPTVKTVDETGTRIVTQPVPEPTPAPRGGFVIQLGAFSVEENARGLADEVRTIDTRVFVREIAGLWRVRVGPVETRVAAIELREKFELAGYPSLVVELTR